MSTRYFIVFFQASVDDKPVVGELPGTTNGEYINKAKTVNAIEESFNCTDVDIVGIIEMSKQDKIEYNE